MTSTPPIVRCLLPLALSLAACKRSPPPAPRFCDEDLSGVWLNASDRHFAYRFRDQGDVVRGEYLERSDGGALKNPGDPITFEMHRTGSALSGVMRSTQVTESGRTCPADFSIKVVSCQPDAMQAVVEMAIPITEDCRRRAAEDGGELPPQLAEFRFERDPHPSGGGEGPDAH
jgi:hypothetical protein